MAPGGEGTSRDAGAVGAGVGGALVLGPWFGVGPRHGIRPGPLVHRLDRLVHRLGPLVYRLGPLVLLCHGQVDLAAAGILWQQARSIFEAPLLALVCNAAVPRGTSGSSAMAEKRRLAQI